MIKKISVFSLALTSILYANNVRLEESVITGVGFEESIGESVKNITVVSREEIEDKGYTSVWEVLKKVPSLTVSRSGGNKPTIDLRGQGGYANRSVAIMIDGIKINSLDDSHRTPDLEVININDIEKIEVIPGGGSVLFGSGTRGGVINIITKKGNFKKSLEAGASIKLGSYKLRQFQANFGKELVEDIYFSANFQRMLKNGYREGTKEDGVYGDGSLRFNFLEHSSVILSGGYSKVESTTADNMLTKKQLDQNRKQSPKTTSKFMGRTFTYHLSENTQRSRKFDIKYKFNNEKLLVEALGFYQNLTSGTFGDERSGFDLRAKYNFDKAYILGGYTFEDIEGKRGTSNKVDKKSNSLFTIGKYDINDIFGISLGYRHEFADYNIQRFSRGKTTQDGSADENNDAFELVLNAKYDEDGNAYIKYERGFISPSPYNRTDKVLRGKPTYIINDLASETYDTIELGLRDMIFGHFVSLSTFYTKSKDEIQIIWDNSGPSHGPNSSMLWHWENLEETERYGVEAFFEEYVLDNLTLSQSLSYIKAENTKGRKKGQKIAYVPNFKAVFSANYDVMDDLRLMADYTHFGKAVDNANVNIPDYGVFDFIAKYDISKNFSLIGGIKNVFDEKYNNYQSSSMDRKTRTMLTRYNPAEERNFFIEFRYKY